MDFSKDRLHVDAIGHRSAIDDVKEVGHLLGNGGKIFCRESLFQLIEFFLNEFDAQFACPPMDDRRDWIDD